MTIIRHIIPLATLLFAVGALQPASAAIVNSSLGNTAPGFGDGDILAVPVVGVAQGGQAAPFNGPCGSELFGSCSTSWTHNYSALADPISSASITIGIYDHDSAATGNQLASFVVEGIDFSASLDAMFEVAGDGEDRMYNEYTVNLVASVFAALADGSALISIALAGPGLVENLLLGQIVDSATNGANLIFSTLTIETDDPTIPAVPIPAAAPLFLSALAIMGLYRRRVLRNQA